MTVSRRAFVIGTLATTVVHADEDKLATGLHKLMEELITGELEEKLDATVSRARQLLEQLTTASHSRNAQLERLVLRPRTSGDASRPAPSRSQTPQR